MITIDDFRKIELKVAKIIGAEPIEGSEKLVKLVVDVKEDNPRQILAGIAKSYPCDYLIGKEIVIITNLEPRQIMGLESNGMLLAAKDDGEPIIITPEKEVVPGSSVG
jgi:methionyl-tRNA synthetase